MPLDEAVVEDLISFARMVARECKTCPLRSLAKCEQCEATAAKAILSRLDAPPPDPGKSLARDRRADILRQLASGPLAASQILCGDDCSRSLKSMTLRHMCQRGEVSREFRNGQYHYRISRPHGQTQNRRNEA